MLNDQQHSSAAASLPACQMLAEGMCSWSIAQLVLAACLSFIPGWWERGTSCGGGCNVYEDTARGEGLWASFCASTCPSSPKWTQHTKTTSRLLQLITSDWTQRPDREPWEPMREGMEGLAHVVSSWVSSLMFQGLTTEKWKCVISVRGIPGVNRDRWVFHWTHGKQC